MANQDFFVNLKFKLEDLSKDITKGAASNFLNEVRKISQELKKLDIQNIPEFKDIFQMGGKIRIDLDFNENEFKRINFHLAEIKSALKELTSGQVLSNEFKKINLHLEEMKSVLKELTSGEVLSKELLNLSGAIENLAKTLNTIKANKSSKELLNLTDAIENLVKTLNTIKANKNIKELLDLSYAIKTFTNTIETFVKTLNTISVNKNIDLSFIKKVITDYKEAIEALPQKPLDENTIIKFLENIYNFLNLIKKIGAEVNSLQDYKFPSKKTIKIFFENFNNIFEYIQEFNKTLRADFIQLTQIENFQSLIGKEKEIREFVISRLELFIETFTRITNIVSNSFPHLLRTFTTYKDDINNYIETIANFIRQFNVSNLMTISESELENIKKIFKMLSEILQELSKVNETIYTPGKYINTDNLLRDLRNSTEIVKEIELFVKDLQNISKVNQIKINKLDITHLFTIINEITKEVENFLKNNNFDSVISGDILKKWEGIDTFLANLTSILKNLSNFKTIKINNQQAENLLEGLRFFLNISQELSSLRTTIQSNLNTDESFFTREDIENLGRIGVILRDLSFFIQNLFDIISNTSIQNFDDIVPKIEKYFNIIRAVLQRIADIIPYINTIYQNLNTGVKLSNFTDFNTFLNSFIYNIDTSNEQLKEIINRNTNFNNTLRMVSTTSERTIQELRNWKELLKGRVINEFQEIFLGSYDLNKILSEYLGRFSSINRLDFSKFNLDILTKLKEILVGADINNPQLVRAIFNNLKNTLRKVGIYLKNTSNINEMKQILSEWEQAIRGLFVSGFSQVNLKLISEHRKTLDYYLNQLDKSLDKTLPYILDKIKNILSKYYKTLGYKSKYEVFNIFKTGIGVEEIINLGLSRITNKIDKQELEKLNRRLQSIIENANKAESRIENVLKQVKVQKGLSFSDEDLQQLDRVLQHLTWKTFQVSWGFIYINMALDKTITKIKDFLRDVIQTSRELQLIQIRLRGLSEQTSKFASYSQQEFKELMAISAKTPYTIRDISEAWTQFKALGIDNMKVFKDTIDTAITFGIEVSKIADDIARAIQGDATAFKNLRHSIGLTNVVIKQFGGSVDDSGRLSNKTFKDIKNNAEALMKYLQRYTGASEKTISSLSQAISNLQDIVNIFYAKTAENLAGLGDYLGKITLSILNVYRTQEGLINELSKTFGTFLLIIAGSIPAVEGLSKAFIIFNDIVFMFMTGISSFGMSLTVLPKFLNNTQRAIKELSLAMGISVKQAESLVNMYRNLHKVVASSSFEIFEIFMNKAISFALNLINFAISFIKTHFFGLLISTLMTVWSIYTKNTILEIEKRRWELNKVKKLLSEDLGATILPEITEETFNFYEILKKITDISDKLVQNFGLTEEKAFKMSKNILLQQSSIEDIYKYMLQLSYLKPFRFTINIQEYIDKLEDYKQAIETLNQTPMFGIQQNLVRTALASIIYYIKIESILRDFIKRITTRKPVEKIPIDFYQQIFTPKYYQDLTKILEIKDKVFTSAKLETRLLIEQTKDFFNLFKEELQKKLIKYISNLEQQILEIIKKISPETKISDIENLSKEILDKLNKNKDFQRLYKDYNLSLFILRNLKVIDSYNLLSKKYLQILSKEDTQEINIPEMFRKVQLFKKNISYLNYNLREFFRNFTTSTELISGINKFIEDISKTRDKDIYETIKFFENKYKLLKGEEIDIRENILKKLGDNFTKYIAKNEQIDLVVRMIEQTIIEILRKHTKEVIFNYPEVLNKILNKIMERLINLKLIEETHRKEVEKIIKKALFGNAISNIIFILRKGVINLNDEVKQVLLQALDKIEMSDEIRNEIRQSIESGIMTLTKENKKTLKNIIKNVKNINKNYQELSKLQFPDDLDDIFGLNKIKNFFKTLKDRIVSGFENFYKEIIQSSLDEVFKEKREKRWQLIKEKVRKIREIENKSRSILETNLANIEISEQNLVDVVVNFIKRLFTPIEIISKNQINLQENINKTKQELAETISKNAFKRLGINKKFRRILEENLNRINEVEQNLDNTIIESFSKANEIIENYNNILAQNLSKIDIAKQELNNLTTSIEIFFSTLINKIKNWLKDFKEKNEKERIFKEIEKRIKEQRKEVLKERDRIIRKNLEVFWSNIINTIEKNIEEESKIKRIDLKTFWNNLINSIKQNTEDFFRKLINSIKQKPMYQILEQIGKAFKDAIKNIDKEISEQIKENFKDISKGITKDIPEQIKEAFESSIKGIIKDNKMYQNITQNILISLKKFIKNVIQKLNYSIFLILTGFAVNETTRKIFIDIAKQELDVFIKSLPTRLKTFLKNLPKNIIEGIFYTIFLNIGKFSTDEVLKKFFIVEFKSISINLIKNFEEGFKKISSKIINSFKVGFNKFFDFKERSPVLKDLSKDIKVLSMTYTFLDNLIRDITLRLSIWLDFLKLSIYVISNNFNKKISNSLLLLYIKYNKITKDILNIIDTGFINFINKSEEILTKIGKGIIQGVSSIIKVLLKLGDLLIKGVLWIGGLILGLATWVGNIIKKIFSPIGKVLLNILKLYYQQFLFQFNLQRRSFELFIQSFLAEINIYTKYFDLKNKQAIYKRNLFNRTLSLFTQSFNSFFDIHFKEIKLGYLNFKYTLGNLKEEFKNFFKGLGLIFREAIIFLKDVFVYGFNLFIRDLKISGQKFIANIKLLSNTISIPFVVIGRIFTKIINTITPKAKEFFEKNINDLLNKFKKPETPPGVPKNIDKLTTEFSKNIRGVSSNLKTLAEIIEEVGKKFQDIRDYKVLQDVKNKILKLKSPFQSLYLIPETLEKQVQQVSGIEKALLRLGIRRFLRGEYKLGPTLLKIAEAWDNTIEKGLTTYEKMVLEGIKRSGFLKNILTFVGKTLRFIADAFLKIGAIIFNIFVDIIDSFIGAFYISQKTGETWIKAFSERFKDTLTGMILSFISNLFKGSFWKNLINNIFNTFLNILSKIADFLWGGTIQKIIEQQEKKKLQDKVKNILISKKLNTDDLNKATDKINNFIKDTINELQTALNKFNQNLQNINIEEFGYAIQEYLRNIFDILVNSKVNFVGKEITLSDLLKEDNLLKYQIEDITQIKILWKSILESIKAYNDAIDKAIDLIKKLYDNTFSYEEMRKKYYDELIQNLKEDEKGVSGLLDEDLKKLEDVYNRIENKKKELIQKLEKFKIEINFDTDKINFKDIVNKLKEKLSIKFEVELKEDMKEEERIKKITNFINILRNTVDLTDKEVDRLYIILGDYATSKNKTQKQEIEKYFKGEEIIQPQYITKEDLVLREKINKYQKEGINLQEEINRLEEEYNNLLNNTQFNIGKIVQKLKELRDISQEIKEKTKGFDIDFLKNLIDITELQIKENTETLFNLMDIYSKKKTEIENSDRELEIKIGIAERKKEEAIKKMQETQDSSQKEKFKKEIEQYEKEIKNYENQKQKNQAILRITEDMIKQLNNKQTALKKNLELYKEEYKNLKDNYIMSQFLNKNLGQSLSQTINFNRNLRSQRGFFENKDIPLFYKVNNILKSMGLNLEDINTLMSKFFDKSGKITEEGILFVRNIFNEYYKDEKEYYDLQKEYIDRNLIGLQKISSITQLINEIEYNTNLTLEERQDLINELLDLQLEELKNLTDIYTGWSKLKEIIRYIGSGFTLTDKQKLDLTDKLTQKAEEYLDLTKNIYEYESSIDEILKQQLVKGLQAIKLNKEKYEKMLDVIKDFKEDKKIEGYIYVLNKVIKDNLLPQEVIEELKERIYNDLFNTETFENHFQKIKEKFIETFKDEKLFNLERVLNPKKIGEFIQNYFKKNNIKINIDFKSDAFKKLIKELGDSLIQIFKEKIDELKGVIEDLRSKFNIPKKEESEMEKIEKLYQQGIITYDEYRSAKSAAGILKTSEEQEKKGGMPYNETVLQWNKDIIGNVLDKAEERLKQKEEELKAQETKTTADFNTSVNNFATAVKNFENAVSALGGLIASLGKGGGAVGGTTQNNQNQQTNQTNINQTNVNNNVNIINNLPSGSVYFPFLGPTE